MNAPVLRVAGLHTRFRVPGGWKTVVNGLDFEVAPRETVAVVGESGSGKSVTAMSIMRLLNPRDTQVSGSVLLGGRDLLALPEPQMRKIRGADIAMIFQEPMTSLNPVRTVGFQVAESLMLHRGLDWPTAQAEALRLLEKVRIPAAATRLKDYPFHLSGGMRQRVMIAMALACRPRLLIADEPTTALDVTIQAQILALIRELQQDDGMSVLFITHDMGVVAEVADRMVVMCGGQQIECGDTARIFDRPTEPYTRALLAAVPRLGAMKDVARPMPFPAIDRQTGIKTPARETANTVRADAPPVLEVQALTMRYRMGSGLLSRDRGMVHAVENVSFSVQPGETLALVGESGCGKSTIGRSIMNLLTPTSGTVRVNGQDIHAARGRDRAAMARHVQMVFQDPFSSLNPRKTVAAAVASPLIVDKVCKGDALRARVAELLACVGLDSAAGDRYPQEFSGGQRQRICIARSLALGPSLLVADEAVSALDVSIKAQIINLMLTLQRDLGLAYLFISHDMAVVERVSHRVAVMYMGEIVEIGSRAAVLYDPRHPYTRRLLDAVPVADPGARLAMPRHLIQDEIRHTLRPPGYTPPRRRYQEVAPGHFVMQDD
ncbi:dipeptide ABC transporter ATP-binding protein [Achromobacter spanius]|uniref:ABC transporter ATP-binding protein n=1 Tax=Achromobacter spanius TaxID=217203 RepID=UPI003A8CE1AF